MTTFLAQNQFLNSGTSPSPAVPDTAAADQVAPQVAAAEPFHNSCGGDVRVGANGANSLHHPEAAGVTPGPHEAIPASTGGPQETSAFAPTKNPDADALDLTDCISEIFFYARKLMKQPPRFVLDEAAFMAEVEETPLFLREHGYLQRREA